MLIITINQLIAFFLILARIAGLVQLAPIFNNREIFSMAKVAMIFWIAIVVVFVVPLSPNMPSTPVAIIFAILIEIMLGAMIGFAMQLFVEGIEFAGSIMDTQAGMSAAATLDPSSGNNTAVLSKLTRWVAVVIFLVIDGHHMVLSGVYQSFLLLPIGSPVHFEYGLEVLFKLGTNIFAVALQIAAPIVLVVFMMDFLFGMLSRVAPQVNVFQLSFQTKPLVSIFIIMSVTPGMLNVIINLLEKVSGVLLQLFAALGRT